MLAVVPARAGSKRLPNKNVLSLNGKALVTYTFEAIQRSKYISKTVVTSDSDEILELSRSFHDTFQVKRPAVLASDHATSIDVLLHSVDIACDLGDFDIVCLLQPTSPLRTASDIDAAIELYIEKQADGVVSMTECEHPPAWSTVIEPMEEFIDFVTSLSNSRSQDFKKHYRLNGAIYLINRDILLSEKKLLLDSNYYPFIMSQKNSVDIDTALDFMLAEAIIKGK